VPRVLVTVLLLGGGGFVAALALGLALAPWRPAAPALFALGVVLFLGWSIAGLWWPSDGVLRSLTGFFNLLGWLCGGAIGVTARRQRVRRALRA
jgi:hypothetical protein